MTPSRPISGFFLALTTAACWGSLPLALQQVVRLMDSTTIVWFRFMAATLGLLVILALLKKLPNFILLLKGSYRWLILLGGIALGANFVLFNTALLYVSPDVTQVLGQISPFLMMIASSLFLKETMGAPQKIGALLLVAGLLLFFNQKLFELFTSLTDYTIGVIFTVSAAVVWVGYGLAQKVMLRRLNSQQILLIYYATAALLITPMAAPHEITRLPVFELCCLAYACLNTLVAYGSYAEALNRWEVSKVSAIITLTPLFTILFTALAHWLAPAIFSESSLNFTSYIGALVVIAGALYSVLGNKMHWHARPTRAKETR
ncbi:DMT family transporter [Pasteurellaceae bacterium TAE3-ERU1]|nr:DMT family transporter [Pasteurellaceae bacterium TAE3-ERU1]